jgi:hypothetical protein
MARAVSLLERLQGIIERTYRMSTGIEEIGRFVLGDDGYRRVYGSVDPVQKVLAAGWAEPGPRLLLRHEGEGFRAAIYYPDRLVGRLETRPPTSGLDEENIDDFAAFVEELDHLLCVAARLRERRPFTLLELELHANVTKYFVAALFLGAARRARSSGATSRCASASPPGGSRRSGVGVSPRRDRLGATERAWLRWHLFDKIEYADADPEIRARYRDAARYAWRFLSRIERLPAERRLAALRDFHRRTHHQNLALLA